MKKLIILCICFIILYMAACHSLSTSNSSIKKDTVITTSAATNTNNLNHDTNINGDAIITTVKNNNNGNIEDTDHYKKDDITKIVSNTSPSINTTSKVKANITVTTSTTRITNITSTTSLNYADNDGWSGWV